MRITLNESEYLERVEQQEQQQQQQQQQDQEQQPVSIKFKRKLVHILRERRKSASAGHLKANCTNLLSAKQTQLNLTKSCQRVDRAPPGRRQGRPDQAHGHGQQQQQHQSTTDEMDILKKRTVVDCDQLQQQYSKHNFTNYLKNQEASSQQYQAKVASLNADINRQTAAISFNSLVSGLRQPKVLPNNTLVEDLSKCHPNLLPKATRATAKSIELFRYCAPKWHHERAAKRKTTGSSSVQPIASEESNKCVLATRIGVDALERCPIPSADLTRLGESELTARQRSSFGLSDSNVNGINHPALTQISNRSHKSRRPKIKFQLPDSVLKLDSRLKRDDYNRALCILTSDVRYQLHLLLYGKLQTIWSLFSTILCILLPLLLLASLDWLALIGVGLLWLTLQTMGLLIGRQCRKKLDRMLEKAVAQVNSYFLDHNLMLGVINVGGLLTRARFLVPLLYFDTSQCREQIESIISVDLRKSSRLGDADEEADKERIEAKDKKTTNNSSARRDQKLALNYSKIGLANRFKLGPENQAPFVQSQLAKKIVLRYSQRWISYYDKQKLMFNDDDDDSISARHLSTGKCLCQFIEEHFRHDDFIEDSDNEQEQEQDQVTCVQSAPLETDKVSPPTQHEQTLEGNYVIGQTSDTSARHFNQGLKPPRPSTVIQMPAPNANYERRQQGQTLCATDLEQELERELKSLAENTVSTDQSSNSTQLFRPLTPRLATDLSLQQQLDLLVASSLGQQQSICTKDKRTNQFKIYIENNNNNNNNNNCSGELSSYSNKLFVNFASYLQQERLESNSSPTTENSLDWTDAGDSIYSSRNDELIRRLKFLLNSRKDEFERSLDGNSATLSHNNSNSFQASDSGRSPICFRQNQPDNGGGGSTQTIHMHQNYEANSRANSSSASPISQLGKRFFSQADGIFFLGSKKNQQGVYGTQQQQILKMC